MPSDKPGPYADLGTLLLDLRTQRGWSLRRAVQEIGGLSHSRLQDFERGLDPHSAIPTRPTKDQLIRFAKAYQVEASRLYRLAGYSVVEDLTEWEEQVLVQLRNLTHSDKQQLEAFLGRLATNEH